MRFTVCVLMAVALVGCAAPRPAAGAPGPTVHVVQEGIHSGLLVPAAWIWAGAGGVAEVSFGDRAWMLGEERGWWRGSRLVLWPSEGAMYLRRVADDAGQAIERQRWRAVAIALSPRGATAMRGAIVGWIVDEGPDIAHLADGAVFRPAAHGFHVFANCHDQVADCLRAAGVPLAGPWLPVRTVHRFHAEVEAAVAELRDRGIRWVEPMGAQ